MKQLMIAAVLLFTMGLGNAYAQPGGNGPRGNGPRDGGMQRQNMDSLYKVWNITDDQKEKLQKLNEEQREAMKALRNDNTSDEARREKMQKMREEQKEKRNKILTKEQAEKWDAYMEQNRRQGPPRN